MNLKELRRTDRHGYVSCDLCNEAADAIETLRAVRDALRETIAEQRRIIETLMAGMPDDGTTPVVRRIAALEAERDIYTLHRSEFLARIAEVEAVRRVEVEALRAKTDDDYRAGAVERVRGWCRDPSYRKAYIHHTVRWVSPEFARPALLLALQVLPDEPELLAALRALDEALDAARSKT